MRTLIVFGKARPRAWRSLRVFLGRCAGLIVYLAIFGALLFTSRGARADGPRRVGIYVQGTDAKTVRKEIVKLVPAGVEVEQSAFGRAIEEKGFARDPKFDTSKKLGERVLKALKASDAELGIVVRLNKKRVAHVLVFKQGDATPQLDENIELGKASGSKEENAALAAKLADVFPSTAPVVEEKAPEAAPEPKSEPEPEADANPQPAPKEAEEATDAVAGGGPRRLVVTLSIGIGARDFEYKERVSALRPYSAWGVALSELDLETYPFANSGGALKNFGLSGSLLLALPSKTKVEESGSSAEPKASYRRYEGALLYRIPLSARAALIVSGAFNAQDYIFSKTGALESSVPSVRYRSLAPALDSRIPLGPSTLSLGAGYRLVLRGGKLQDRFPHSSVAAIDGHLGASFPLGRGGWELRLLLRYERYFYKMHSALEDRYVAGGALDQYFTALGGVGYGF